MKWHMYFQQPLFASNSLVGLSALLRKQKKTDFEPDKKK